MGQEVKEEEQEKEAVVREVEKDEVAMEKQEVEESRVEVEVGRRWGWRR